MRCNKRNKNKMKRILKAALAGMVLAVSSLSHASLINVSYVEITSSVPVPGNSHLQVSELVLWGTQSQSDLALTSAGAVASASDFYLGNRSCDSNTSDASCVLDGIGPVAWDSIYHGNFNDGTSMLTVTLPTPSAISWFEIFGRTNSCCTQRDVYNITFFNQAGDALQSFTNVSAVQGSRTGQINVSEPSAIALLGLGLLGFASRRFKK
jgi:hypothetical protein